jgi:hypothetical protein
MNMREKLTCMVLMAVAKLLAESDYVKKDISDLATQISLYGNK